MEGDPSTPAKGEASSVSTTAELPLVDRFQALVSVAESITSCREPEDLFRRLAAELERVVRFDFVAFVLHDPERGVVRGDLLDARSMALAPRPEAALAESPSGFVVETQQPLVVPDTSIETRFSEMTLIRQDGIESFCVLPLTTAHKRIGALGFGRRQRAAYPAGEV